MKLIYFLLFISLFGVGSVSAADITTGICNNEYLQPFINIVSTIVNIIKIEVPVILIVLGMIDMGKVVASQKDKKIVLNQSLINSKDILDFEYEARFKIFYNLPPLDERDVHNVPLNAFLVRLGFERQQDAESENRKKILGLF